MLYNHLGYVWFLQSTKERKNVKENYFLIFGRRDRIVRADVPFTMAESKYSVEQLFNNYIEELQ